MSLRPAKRMRGLPLANQNCSLFGRVTPDHNAAVHSASDILVSIEHRWGTAAVGWAGLHGLLWLSSLADRGPGTGLVGYETAIEGLADEHTVQGGRLPPGATAAEVVDDTGRRVPANVANGAWIVVVDQEADDTLPVRFFDDSGQAVARPWPEEWPREPVADADEPCPACGGTSWSMLTRVGNTFDLDEPDDEDWGPSRMVVCDTCGNGSTMGSFISFDRDEDDEVPSEEMQRAGWEMLEARENAAKAALEKLSFPIYQAKGAETRLLGWGGGDVLNEVTVGMPTGKERAGAPAALRCEPDFESLMSSNRARSPWRGRLSKA